MAYSLIEARSGVILLLLSVERIKSSPTVVLPLDVATLLFTWFDAKFLGCS